MIYKHSFYSGSLPEFGDLYHEVPKSKTDSSLQAAQNWHTKLEIERAETNHKSNFVKSLEALEERNEDKDVDIHQAESNGDSMNQQLDEEVKLWSDFLRTRFHPKTNVVLGENEIFFKYSMTQINSNQVKDYLGSNYI